MSMRLSSADLPEETTYSAQELDPNTLTHQDLFRIVRLIEADYGRLDFIATEKRYENSPTRPSVKISSLIETRKPEISADTVLSVYERIRYLGAQLVKDFVDVTLQICNSEDYRPYPHNLASTTYLRYMGRFYVLSHSTEKKDWGLMAMTLHNVFEIRRLLKDVKDLKMADMRELAEHLFAGEKKLAMAIVRDGKEKGTDFIFTEEEIEAFEEIMERKDLEAEQRKARETEASKCGKRVRKEGEHVGPARVKEKGTSGDPVPLS